MKYHDGSTISLGDIVRVAVPGGTEKARVVMLGDSREHLDIDKQFLAWVQRDDKVLEPNYVVVEFLDRTLSLMMTRGMLPSGITCFHPPIQD